MNQDRIYSAPLKNVGDFEFDDAVADVFPDMIRRSVPGYGSMLTMIAQCGERFGQPDTHIYDLGCSLGAGTLLLREHAPAAAKIVAVDSSAAMISRLDGILAAQSQPGPVETRLADIRDMPISSASLCVLNLTLQFLCVEDRTPLLEKIAAGTHPGGALLLSEKICFQDETQQQLMTDLHHDFKRAHGYSDLEIAQKRTAIENRLVPETLEAHIERLQAVGYRTVTPWFQCFTFASLLAVK
ncbi:MAG: carboxy-S-adenosyl-L-methionine synthase CmoA [Planctomycetaceae bacterium]|nr:carboxy-S-adenosyl-L-methionine synthase CmoA [Planctomycetaceae bacterium]